MKRRKEEAQKPVVTEKRVARENKQWEDQPEKKHEARSVKEKKQKAKDVDRIRESLLYEESPLVALGVPRSKRAIAHRKEEGKVLKSGRRNGKKKSFGSAQHMFACLVFCLRLAIPNCSISERYGRAMFA